MPNKPMYMSNPVSHDQGFRGQIQSGRLQHPYICTGRWHLIPSPLVDCTMKVIFKTNWMTEALISCIPESTNYKWKVNHPDYICVYVCLHVSMSELVCVRTCVCVFAVCLCVVHARVCVFEDLAESCDGASGRGMGHPGALSGQTWPLPLHISQWVYLHQDESVKYTLYAININSPVKVIFLLVDCLRCYIWCKSH